VSRILSTEETVIHTTEQNNFLRNKQALVNINTLNKSQEFKLVLEMIEPDSWSLLEPAKALPEFEDLPWIEEAPWHLDAHTLASLLLRSHLIEVGRLVNVGIDKGRGEVCLLS